MRFGILGPLRARRPDGVPIPLGGPRLRALLAMLLLDAGRPVPIDRLIDGLYGQEPPLGAANALQAQVSRLRRSLPVELGPAGYRLAVPPGEVDAHRFAALAADGHQALADGDPDRAAVLLTEATGIWTGDPLIDVRHAPFAGAQVTRLTEARLTAVEDLQEAELQRIGPLPPGTVPVLRDLTTTHPLRERPHALLMRALTATGRPAEALSVYETIRRALADELGADPSPELTALHIALLRRATPAGDSPAHRPHLAGAAPRPPSHDDTPADQHRRTSLRPPIPPITSRRAAREEIETPHETAREQHETPHRIAREQHGSPHPVAREQHESPHPATREEHGATHQSASEEGDAPHQVAKERGDAPHQVDGEVREPGATTHQAAQDEHGPRTPIRHGVPSQVNSFVGRDDEVTRSVHTLSTRRLVTLHGPGGAGKTRLAAEIAAWHDGDVYFTELAAAGPDEVPRTVLAALGLRDVILNTPNPQPPPSVAPGPRPEPSSSSAPSGPRQLLYARPHSTVATDSPPARDVMERLVTALGERRLLLVLDNCEHVVEAAAELTARLLSGTPGVRVLATSREPLG
ncbi:MAG TPA: BTAD domain-containing putative transcriptional regulator, partial [Actinoplanes sp.]|nr:BTAD domain-containing putative transcriptional regulator [Actinoplanes sp.]